MPKMDPSWARSGHKKEQPREQIPWKFPIREASWPFFLTIGFESTFRPPKDPKMAPRGPLWGGLGGPKSTPKRPKTGSWAKIAFQNRHKQFQIKIFTRNNPNLGPKLGPKKGLSWPQERVEMLTFVLHPIETDSRLKIRPFWAQN